MAFEDWDKNADGTVKVCPLLGYESFRPFGMMCGLRLHYSESEAKLAAGEAASVPLIMNPAQARELGEALTRLADAAEFLDSGEAER
jgi:hypothetical protein